MESVTQIAKQAREHDQAPVSPETGKQPESTVRFDQYVLFSKCVQIQSLPMPNATRHVVVH